VHLLLSLLCSLSFRLLWLRLQMLDGTAGAAAAAGASAAAPEEQQRP
jgi:hypothetical protein